MQEVFLFSRRVYPLSALRMEAVSYCDPSAMAYQNTRCHNAEAQNINIDCSQNHQSYTIL